MPRLSRLLALIWKDFVLDARRFSEAGSMLIFVAAASVLAGYAVREASSVQASVASVLVVMVFLAVYTALSSFIREAERGTLDGLRVAPLAPEELFTAKLLYSAALLVSTSLVYTLLYSFFSGDASLLAPHVAALIAAQAVYMSAASSLASAILVYSEARAFLLPVTITVLILPYLQATTPLMLDAAKGAVIAAADLARVTLMALGFAALTVILSRFVLEAV